MFCCVLLCGSQNIIRLSDEDVLVSLLVSGGLRHTDGKHLIRQKGGETMSQIHFFVLFVPLVVRILEPMMFFLLKEKSPDIPHHNGVLSQLQDLPCGCQSNASEKMATWPGHHAVPGTKTRQDSVRQYHTLQDGTMPRNMFC